MTPHKQLIKHDPANGRFGDCHRTCIAMILDLEPSEIPHFNQGVYPDTPEGAPEYDRAVQAERDWLSSHGLAMLTVPFPGDHPLESLFRHVDAWAPRAPVILGGTSGLGSGHSCVYFEGQLHDPSGNGLVGPMKDGYWWITAISVGGQWNARGIKRRQGFECLATMSEDERRRWDEGRDDWRDSEWEDHCGRSDCEFCDKGALIANAANPSILRETRKPIREGDGLEQTSIRSPLVLLPRLRHQHDGSAGRPCQRENEAEQARSQADRLPGEVHADQR